MKRYLAMVGMLVGLLAVNCSCGPASSTRKQGEPDYVAVESLVDAYHGGFHHYDGRLVQVHLKAGSYRINRSGWIEAHLCGPSETIRFECRSLPTDESRSLLLTGRCSGYIRDRVERCDDRRIVWYVRVEECSLTILD